LPAIQLRLFDDGDADRGLASFEGKFVLAPELGGKRLAAYVDPSRPNAWKGEPYYSQFKRSARMAIPKRDQVVVYIRRRAIVILPDEDVDLGVIGDDELIVTWRETRPLALS
jgi:hypothetical protein